MTSRTTLILTALAITPTIAFAAPAAVDSAFAAMVSQGGMFEVMASKLAVDQAQAQDVKDFAVAEVHDHTLVGDKLKAVSEQEGIIFSTTPNAMFQTKLDRLKALSGHAFDVAYMNEMADIHAKDGAAFKKEVMATSDPGFKAFAAETYTIVERHIGAIHAAPPPGS